MGKYRRNQTVIVPNKDVNLSAEEYYDKYLKQRHSVLQDLIIKAKKVDLTGICPLIIM